jgi:hypothetical protein
MSLAPIDWILIASYFALSLAIGLAYRKRAGSSLEEYFLSGRSLPWWMAGTSMVATTFAADTPLAVTGSSPAMASPETGSGGRSPSGMITVFVYAPLATRGVMTDIELVELRYAESPPPSFGLSAPLHRAPGELHHPRLGDGRDAEHLEVHRSLRDARRPGGWDPDHRHPLRRRRIYSTSPGSGEWW